MPAHPDPMDDDTLALLEQLIARASVTPQDAGCLELIGARLEAALRYLREQHLNARVASDMQLAQAIVAF